MALVPLATKRNYLHVYDFWVKPGLALVTVPASAQFYNPYNSPFGSGYNRSYTIQAPGQLPTYVNPSFGGGYTVQRPGHLPTYINPQ
jgi:hypothetical protein